jgi:peroxiredoxin
MRDKVMLKKSIIFFSLFIYVQILSALSPDTLIIETKRIKGFGPVGPILKYVPNLPEDSPWQSIIPEIQGIPDTLENFMFDVEQTDIKQNVYQNYYLGNISEKRFLELKKEWNWEPDSTRYTKNYVKVGIAVAAGIDRNNNKIVIFDQNNNNNLSDDEIYKLPPILPGQHFFSRYHDGLPVEAEFEYFYNSEIIKTKGWFYIDYSSDYYNSPDSIKKSLPLSLSIGFAEHQIAEFNLEGIKFMLALCSMSPTYRQQPFLFLIDNKDDKFGSSVFSQRINLGEMIKLGETYYKFNDVSIDGKYITLIKEEKHSISGGTNIGQKIYTFSSMSITGEELNIENYRGKYVYLDFWGTWCGPCLEEIPELKNIYNLYKDHNFEIIGIALDKVENVKQFIIKNDIKWPQIVQDASKAIINLFEINSYPTTFLIDPEGIIIDKGIKSNDLYLKLAKLINN